MATAAWLERLGRATEYRDLQEILAEIATSARLAANGPELAEAIDEAIRRLMQERSRDEEELKAIEDQYGTFKEQQQGVVGWLKRHIPFTETRRQEREHKHSIADQKAEILADGFMIARAQLIKEQLLSPETRQVGHDAAYWSRRLEGLPDASQIPQFAADIQALADEQCKARAFLEQVGGVIQAFAAADFSSTEDRQARDIDVAAGRSELQALQFACQEKDGLRSNAIGRLGQLVEEELEAKDADYRSLKQRLASLVAARTLTQECQRTATGVRDALKSLLDLEQERTSLPRQRDQLESKARRLKDEAQASQRTADNLSREQQRHTDQYQAAVRSVEQAASALDAAKRLHEAYLREQRVAERDPSAAPSAVEAEYLRMQDNLQRAQAQLRSAAAPYEAANKQSEDARRKSDALQLQYEEAMGQYQSLADQERQLGQDLPIASDRLQRALGDLRPLADRLQHALRALTSSAALPGSEALASATWDSRALTQLDRFLTAVSDHAKRLEREVKTERDHEKQVWERHCERLLGHPLAAELAERRLARKA